MQGGDAGVWLSVLLWENPWRQICWFNAWRHLVVVPVETESFVVIIHLKSDWATETPVDVQQPLEDELSIVLDTDTNTHITMISSIPAHGDILLARSHGGSILGVRAVGHSSSEPSHLRETPSGLTQPFFIRCKGEVTSEKAAKIPDVAASGHVHSNGWGGSLSQKWNSKFRGKLEKPKIRQKWSILQYRKKTITVKLLPVIIQLIIGKSIKIVNSQNLIAKRSEHLPVEIRRIKVFVL